MGCRDSGLSSFMRHLVKKRLCRLTLAMVMLWAALTGCVHYRFDARPELMQTPDAQIWAVGLQKSDSGYRTHSITKLNGANPMSDEPTALIASGSTGNWQWEVRAVPSLLASWKTWQNDKKVQQRAADPDDWSHPAATWEQAFTRAHKVVNYLLGRPPLPLKLTMLLVPDGSAYNKAFVQTGPDFVPLTFAFYYPLAASETKALTASRFSALVEAVSTTVYEYQHVLIATEIIKPMGKNETDKTINDETRSQCWSDSTFLALTSGTHTESTWNPALAREALLAGSSGRVTSQETGTPAGDAQEDDQQMQRHYSDAWRWGKYLEAKSISVYLRMRGLREAKVVSNEPAAMNAVLSACRAMTQRPLDLTSGDYPASQVEYVPFFPPGALDPSK